MRNSDEKYQTSLFLYSRANGLFLQKVKRNGNVKQLFKHKSNTLKNANRTVKEERMRQNESIREKCKRNQYLNEKEQFKTEKSLDLAKQSTYKLFNPKLPEILEQRKEKTKSMQLSEEQSLKQRKIIREKRKNTTKLTKIPFFIEKQILKSQEMAKQEPIHMVEIDFDEHYAFQSIDALKRKEKERNSYRVRKSKAENPKQSSFDHRSTKKHSLFEIQGPHIMTLNPSQNKHKKVLNKHRYKDYSAPSKGKIKKNQYINPRERSVLLEGWQKSSNSSCEEFHMNH